MRKIKGILKANKIDMVLVQETKKDTITKFLAQSLWPDSEFDSIAVDAIGSAEGLLCMWNCKLFKLDEIRYNKFFILMSSFVLPYFKCVIVKVHAPNCPSERRAF